MNLSNRYALAIYKHGEEHNFSSVLESGVKKIKHLFDESLDMCHFFHDLFISDSKKLKVIQDLLGDELSKEMAIVLQFLFFKRRLSVLPYICNDYIHLHKKKMSIVDVNLYANLSDFPQELKALITKNLQKNYPDDVFNFVLIKDESIVSGYRIKIRDKVYNYTVNYYLKEFKKKLLN